MNSTYDFIVKVAILWYYQSDFQHFSSIFELVYFSEESSFAAVIMVQTDQKKVMVNRNHRKKREKCSNWPVIKPVTLMKTMTTMINELL